MICHGAGYVANSELGALLDSITSEEHGFIHHISIDMERGGEGGPIDVFLTPEGKTGGELDIHWAEGKTHTVTILRAVAKALVAQKERP